MVDILGFAGYHVLRAADGAEALRLVGQQRVEVMVLDMAMPLVDGLPVLQALGPPPPKVILLSAWAYNTPEDIDRMGLGKKVTRILRKPCARWTCLPLSTTPWTSYIAKVEQIPLPAVEEAGIGVHIDRQPLFGVHALVVLQGPVAADNYATVSPWVTPRLGAVPKGTSQRWRAFVHECCSPGQMIKESTRG